MKKMVVLFIVFVLVNSANVFAQEVVVGELENFEEFEEFEEFEDSENFDESQSLPIPEKFSILYNREYKRGYKIGVSIGKAYGNSLSYESGFQMGYETTNGQIFGYKVSFDSPLELPKEVELNTKDRVIIYAFSLGRYIGYSEAMNETILNNLNFLKGIQDGQNQIILENPELFGLEDEEEFEEDFFEFLEDDYFSDELSSEGAFEIIEEEVFKK